MDELVRRLRAQAAGPLDHLGQDCLPC
jgi:hypothetical protein